MRSSNKSRSRSKSSNRSRGVGNVVNRVFDSAGPEGKVRGTPQQIIEKYQTLARDAQLSGDRVAAENFQQHSEHYTRMLNDAQREQAERQAAENRNRPQQQGQADDQQPQQPQSQQPSDDQAPQQTVQDTPAERPAPRNKRNGAARGKDSSATEVLGDEPDSGLVDTPESSKQSADSGKPGDADGNTSGGNTSGGSADGGGDNGGARPRSTRGRPRKAAAKQDGSGEAELPLDQSADTIQ